MSELPIQVNALAVEKSDDKFIVTVGFSNRKTNQWVIGMEMALLLVTEIHGSLQTGEKPVE